MSEERSFRAGQAIVKREIERAAAAAKVDRENTSDAELEEQKERQRVVDQAFLLLNWQRISEESKNNPRFTQFAQINSDRPEYFNSKLFKNPVKYDILLNARSEQLSYFLPKIRIFKEYKTSKNEFVSFELPLENQYTEEDFNSIFVNREGRGGGVGVKSFNWSTLGKGTGNMYSFEATLELFFESIEEITKVRRVDQFNGKMVETSFADLLIQRKKTITQADGSAVYDPNYYRIKAMIGWHIPSTLANNSLDSDFIEDLKNSNLVVYLGLHSHEIDIQPDCSVVLKIRYIAYIETLIESPKISNVFFSTQYDEKVENKRKELDEYMEKKGVSDSDKDKEMERLKKEIEINEVKGREEAYRRILNYIYQNNMIKYDSATEEEFKNFVSLTKTLKVSNDAEASKKQIDAYNSKIKEIKEKNATGSKVASNHPSSTTDNLPAATTQEDLQKNIKNSIETYEKTLAELTKQPDRKIIPYFYLGDLFESILQGMYQGNNFNDKELKLILGPLVFYDYGDIVSQGVAVKPQVLKNLASNTEKEIVFYTGARKSINIADIPISLETYNTWFLKNIIDAGVTYMSFREFATSILYDLVLRATGPQVYSFAPRQRTQLVFKTKSIPKDENRFVLAINPGGVEAGKQQGGETKSGQKQNLVYDLENIKPFVHDPNEVNNVNELENFMFIYSMAYNAWDLISDYSKDIEKGIRHLYYGNEHGFLKNIKFNRQDNKYIRTNNIKLATSQNPDKAIILREMYNATVEMHGNSFFEIGELVYISPTFFGTSNRQEFAKELGIGGYFMISKINSSISEGSYSTTMELIWNARGDGIPNNVMDSLRTAPENEAGLKKLSMLV